ncbi:thiamine phosphate synthase [Rubinisphaera italica]|uniref:Thiamine-phosphate synthase n=1 Tax=Rubinisphaera italica TaxID=2527969 RepID=A0A5C5XPA2_9PLAN|nr:thiamine phosphate synthase [Rubinisphaera italica]TWT64281.1 Thiamine-phosphate synthase [Rubinisphaera italica]
MTEESISQDLPTLESRSVFRILDAAANRCREGLRIIEDYVRFHRNEESLSSDLKQLRHDFRNYWKELDPEQLLQNRDTAGDIGTAISTAAENVRASLLDVVAANCKRVEESLRTLEEYSKLISTTAARGFEQLRYRFYGFEQELLLENQRKARIGQASVYFLLTEKTCVLNWQTTAEQAITLGVDVIQLREKELDDRELLARARWLRDATRHSSTLLIINDRPDIALLCDADGVHVGQEELCYGDVRKLLGPQKLIGISTHNMEQAREAVAAGADYVGAGPTFLSETKSFSEFAGLEFLRQMAAEISIPVFAIGGIGQENVEEVAQAGISRIAVCQAISQSQQMGRIIQEMKNILSSGNNREENRV